MNEWMNEWVSEWVSEWMNEWINEWMNEWMNEWQILHQPLENDNVYDQRLRTFVILFMIDAFNNVYHHFQTFTHLWFRKVEKCLFKSITKRQSYSRTVELFCHTVYMLRNAQLAYIILLTYMYTEQLWQPVWLYTEANGNSATHS